MAAYLDDYFGAGQGKVVPLPPKTPTAKPATPDATPAAPVDGRSALAKLTGGQTLTEAEKQYLNLAPTPAKPVIEPSTFPVKGTSAGFEVSSDGKTRREKLNDGMGGYTYGDWVTNPNYNTGSTDLPAGTNIDVLKAVLRGRGMPESVINASTDFLTKVLFDLGGETENAAEVFLNGKEYTFKDGTKSTSPFYTAYGYLNDGLANPKPATEIYNFVEGAKQIIAKYGMSDKFLTPDSLKQYIANGVTAEDLDARGNLYRLKSLQTDKAYIDSLKAGGYISSDAQLQDFFADPKIGKAQFEQNAAVAGIGAEAIRRASAGITYNKARFEQLAAGLQAQGYDAQQAQTIASKNFETIGLQLQPTEMLGGIYERTKQDTNSIQAQLETEAFGGMASEKRKRLKAQEEAAFQGQSGTSTYSLSTGGGLGQMF